MKPSVLAHVSSSCSNWKVRKRIARLSCDSEIADRALELYFAKSTTRNIFILHKRQGDMVMNEVSANYAHGQLGTSSVSKNVYLWTAHC